MKKAACLKRGDRVAVVSPSSGLLGEKDFIHKYHLARERLEKDYDLELVAMPNSLKGLDWCWRHPEGRAEDLMAAFEDDSISGVFAAIGGDDSIRLLPYLEPEVFLENPKIFTGYSDTTTLHFFLQREGLSSFYGGSLMNQWAEYVEINPYTKQALNMLFDPKEETPILASPYESYEPEKLFWGEENMHLVERPRHASRGYRVLQGEGAVEGRLVGGCLDVFPELLGTSLWPTLNVFQDALLLLETSESNMPESLLLSLLRNFAAQGIFDVISGIVVGRPCYRDKEKSYPAVYRKAVAEEAGHPELPILYNVNIGHAYPSGLLPLGLRYRLDASRGSLVLLESPCLKD